MKSLAIGIRLGSRGALGDALPDLVLTPGAVSTNTTAPAGTLLAVITNVPTGVTPTISPSDGRVVIAGSEAYGWEIHRGGTAGSSGLTNFTVSATGANSATLAVTFTTAWAIGLDRTPAYVTPWTQHGTLAKAKAMGTIPADAIDFATGNGGGAFASYSAWIDACNAANSGAGAPGAINQDVTTAHIRKYLKRGIYGYSTTGIVGGPKPKITVTGRTSAASAQQALFYTYLEDVTIKGVEVLDAGAVIAVGQKTLPLIETSGMTFTGSITSNVLTLTVAVSGGTLGVNNQIRGAQFNASFSGTTMTVSSFSGGFGSGTLQVGSQLFAPGMPASTTITALGTGTGGTGTYTISNSFTTPTSIEVSTGIGTGGRPVVTAVLSGTGGVGSTYQLSATPNIAATALYSPVIDPQPYHTSTQPITYICDPVVGTAAGFHCPRLAKIVTSGTFNISAISITRQIANFTAMSQGPSGGSGSSNPSNNNTYFSDQAWASVLETVNLFTGASCTTNAAIVAAINANTTAGLAHGYAAVLSVSGDVYVIANTVNTPSFVDMTITQTGTAATFDVKTPAVTITHNQFTDCNIVYAALLDVAELGAVEFHANEMPGTWSGVYAQVTRWNHFRAANNHWYDCLTARVRTQTGRPGTGAALPSGSSLSEWNTLFYMGTDSPHMMRYQTAGTTCLIENNDAHDVESYNSTNTVNAAVFADIRNCWQRVSNGRINRIAYNRIVKVKGIRGAEDANALYGKPRGMDVVANYIEEVGAEWYATGTQDGSEFASGFKNPGWWNRPYTSAFGTNEIGEPFRFLGNQLVNCPSGLPVLKIDERYEAGTYVCDNLIQNWKNFRNGVEQTAGNTTGGIRITDGQRNVYFKRNRFVQCDPGTTDSSLLVNMWNLANANGGTFTAGNFQVDNNELHNDGSAHASGTFTVYGADTSLIKFNFGGGLPGAGWLASVATGFNRILTALGADSGFRMLQRETSRAEVSIGTNAVSQAGYGTVDYLASYGANL